MLTRVTKLVGDLYRFLLQIDFALRPWLECICTRPCTWLLHAAANLDMFHKASSDFVASMVRVIMMILYSWLVVELCADQSALLLLAKQ
jgi:hypothetical protein